MKKLVAFLLLLFTITGTFVPCCMEDDCNVETATTENRHSNHQEEKGGCSPFFACRTCPQAVEISSPVALPVPVTPDQPVHYSFYFSELSNYYSSPFQPPRA